MMTHSPTAEASLSDAAPSAASHAVLLGDNPVKIWGVSSAERLRRQLRAAGLAEASASAPPAGDSLLLHGGWVFDEALVRALKTAAPGTVLVDEDSGCAVAARADAAQLADVAARLGGPAAALPAGCTLRTPATLAGAYNRKLRKREPPLLLRLTAESAPAIERRTFAASYKGVTDLVTKYVWPWPARHVTRFCAHAGITPNQVTLASLALVIVAYFLFESGHYGTGLVAAWAMTFLDTVDGKLARVTLQSSRFGDIFDHGIDLIHPPFWWWAWVAGLAVAGHPLDDRTLVLGIVLVGYVAQRLEEGLFQLWFGIALHIWQPFDSVFREITARRNPNLLILTVSALFGRPDLGMQLVAVWVLICFVVHAVRIVQAAWARRRGPLQSWLAR